MTVRGQDTQKGKKKSSYIYVSCNSDSCSTCTKNIPTISCRTPSIRSMHRARPCRRFRPPSHYLLLCLFLLLVHLTRRRFRPPPIHLPPSLPSHLSIAKHSAAAARLKAQQWTEPHVVLSYTRPHSDSHAAAFLYTTGVSMGTYQRNFTAAGCLVNSTLLYPIHMQDSDVFICHIPLSHVHSVVDLVLHLDTPLRRAITLPAVTLRFGLSVSLNSSHIIPLTSVPGVTSIPDSIPSPLARARENYAVVPSAHAVRRTTERSKAEMLRSPRWEICMATQMKTFPHLLEEWISHHRRLGVDMVYILDNDSADDLKQQFRNREDVQTIYWPWEKSQTQALSFLLASARGSCEWLLLSDADEYVLLGGREAGWQGRKTLKHLVARKRALGFAQVFFRYVTMGPSGRVFMPDMALAEAYLHKSERQKDNGKVVSLTDHEWVSSRIHRSYSGADNLLDCKGHFEDWDGMPLKSGDTPALVHFQFRSLQELIRKGRDGTASVLDSIGIETREFDMENPPGQFTYTDERLRFTFFRDFWRSVKQFGGMHDQNIVRTDESGMRCVVKRDVYSGRLTPQGCTSVKLF